MLKLKTAAAAAALLPRLRFEVAYVKNMPHFLFKLHLQFIAYHTAPGRSASSNKTSIFIFCFCSRYVPCVAQHPDLDSRPNLFLQWLVHKWVLSSYGDAMIMLMGNDPWWWWWSEIWVDRWMRRCTNFYIHCTCIESKNAGRASTSRPIYKPILRTGEQAKRAAVGGLFFRLIKSKR